MCHTCFTTMTQLSKDHLWPSLWSFVHIYTSAMLKVSKMDPWRTPENTWSDSEGAPSTTIIHGNSKIKTSLYVFMNHNRHLWWHSFITWIEPWSAGEVKCQMCHYCVLAVQKISYAGDNAVWAGVWLSATILPSSACLKIRGRYVYSKNNWTHYSILQLIHIWV